MAKVQDIDAKVATVQDLLTEKFGVKKRPLDKMLRRTGRRLPRGMHKKAQQLVDAQKLAGHPKLAMRLNPDGLNKAYDALTAHLQAIDVAERRKARLLSLAGTLAFNLLVVGAGFVFWLWWAGYV